MNGRKTITSRSTSPPARRYKFDIGSLVVQNKKDLRTEAGLKTARIALESMERKYNLTSEQQGKCPLAGVSITSQMITSAIKHRGDESDASRLMLAIQRTEALQMDKSWSFFDAQDEIECPEMAPFPSGASPLHDLMKGMSRCF